METVKYKKQGVLLIISVFVILIAVSFAPASQQAQVGFKNLKVLPKDITKDKLDSTMDYYALSLGVRCGFCHARSADSTKRRLDFASDAKDEKNIARHMMQMTAYLNSNYFNFNNSTQADTIHVVTCFTCHRGSSHADALSLLPQLNTLKEEQKKEFKKNQKNQKK